MQYEIKLIPEYASKFLALREKHVIEYRNANRSQRNKLRERHRQEALECVDELLAPHQRTRLKQLAYRIEIATIGMGKAITRGFLAKAVGVKKEQTAGVEKTASEANKLLEEAVDLIRTNAESKLLLELAPEQRKAATKAIGDPWFYETLSSSQLDFQDELERVRASKDGGKTSRHRAQHLSTPCHVAATG